MNFLTDRNRIHCLNQSSVSGTGRIIYWMSREHRIDDNWALLHALELADGGRQVEVVAAVSPPVAESSRSFSFRMAVWLRLSSARPSSVSGSGFSPAGVPRNLSGDMFRLSGLRLSSVISIPCAKVSVLTASLQGS